MRRAIFYILCALALLFLALLLWVCVSTPLSGQSPIGVQLENAGSVNWANVDRVKPLWVKLQMFSQDQPGILDYQPLPVDLQVIATAHSKGYRVLVSAEGCRTTPLGCLGAYTAFLKNLTANGVDAIEIWNEENSPDEFHGTSADYAQLEWASYDAIRSVSKTTLVIVGALQPNPTEQEWAATVRSLPGNCQGIHYEDSPLHSPADRMAQITAFYGARSVCFTEVGVLSHEGFSEPLGPSFYWAKDSTNAKQAEALRETVRLFSRYSSIIVLFNLDFSYHGADPMGEYAILRPDGSCSYCP